MVIAERSWVLFAEILRILKNKVMLEVGALFIEMQMVLLTPLHTSILIAII
ncbi:hypothetical protein LINGRAHAP2_LOCUS15573 [Linum grandiflorum]